MTKELQLSELKPWLNKLTPLFSKKQLILLTGDLGAGKTQWVRSLLECLGSEEVSSPTYGLIHEYSVQGLKNVFHIDLYRLKDEEDLESSGFWDLFSMDEGLILVEWANRLDSSLFPLHWSRWELEITPGMGAESRVYKLKKN
jgi:tRNA threonylcarbamoyladenosine biosynthesis protein TsaE